MNDKKQIIRSLKLFFQPGDIFELRVLNASRSGYVSPHTESGYFDYDHIEVVPGALNDLREYTGAYVTVNKVNPDLLARAANRLRPIKRESTTADSDILSRRWLLIDCDAVRPSGISSSIEEHEAALYKAIEISDGLKSMGFPEPIMLNSGNGAQLMYRVDLPVNDDGLVQACLNSLEIVKNVKVHIDQTVFNPARIWRLPGTMNCKGDNLEARPHRQAQIISAPDTLEIVPIEKLQELADSVKETVNCPEIPDTSGFNIDEWIAQYCPEAEAPQAWKDGRKWILPVCPFNEAHTNRSALIIEQATGAIAFKCHHNGCSGNDWHALRELKEPGCYDVPQEFPEVDLSGILNQNKPNSGGR